MSSQTREAARFGKLALTFPETTYVEVEGWGGEPTWRVRDKIFLFGGTQGHSLGLKVGKDLMEALVSAEPRVTQMAYIGRHGWVSIDLVGADAAFLDEVEGWLQLSYRLVAPKALGKLVDD